MVALRLPAYDTWCAVRRTGMSSHTPESGIRESDTATAHPADAPEEPADKPPQDREQVGTTDAADPAQPARRAQERVGSAGGGPYPQTTSDHEP